ncbi:type IV secretory system conjugative DNA transfer family protein [Leptospirillum ferriphilum]|uniref:type IV secretory system conjugative DNA transfer family protein n=1 Tax=Leptospirillum ferriphilum TaxID=178606 RepID=UPI0006B1985A|nr:type IV secretory system conjugative DNA transfer family protein [Leptospirillum ferriphilum]
MKNRIAAFFVLSLALPGIALAANVPTSPNSRQSLPTLGQAEHPKSPSEKIRKRALREAAQKKAALAWGAQAGYAKRTEFRNRWLRSHAQVLDRIFTFRPFIDGDGHVLWPSVSSGRSGFRLENPISAGSMLVSYRIHEPARIVSIPPTFRDYIVLSPGTPKEVNPILLPKNSREKKRWKEWTDKGWETGERLSDRAFMIGTRRLVRAIEGRLRFYELSLAGQIERPTWARSPAATLRTGKVLEIGDTILRITRPARFTAADRWKPLSVEEGK